CGRFGKPEDRLWQFEFVVARGEDGKEMSEHDNIKRIVFPYITHPGSRYGLKEDVAFPEDCITVLRCRPFAFAARNCNKWALGRVMLLGDAAHVFPPFGGQGIASGFRDASALAWWLAVACRPNFKPYEQLLEAWYNERKQQLDRSLNATVETVPSSPMIPSVRRWLEQGARRFGMTRYTYQPGMEFIPKGASGLFLPQIYCLPLIANNDLNKMAFTDDIIFHPSKKCIFQVLILLDKLDETKQAAAVFEDIDNPSDGELSAREATYLIHNLNERFVDPNPFTARIATAKEFAQSPLCKGRPEPRYYDEYHIKKEVKGYKYLIIRPDRLIYASCVDKVEVDSAAKALPGLLNGETHDI
ncbi:hypothetical protein BZG36_04730, partial [Bifiguratus adelaidae]